jgi:hypothetical protein
LEHGELVAQDEDLDPFLVSDRVHRIIQARSLANVT